MHTMHFYVFLNLVYMFASFIVTEGYVVQEDAACRKEHGACNWSTYEYVRLRPLRSSGCRDFCQCEHASTEVDGSVTYRWAKHSCPATTLFDAELKVCNHGFLVRCKGNDGGDDDCQREHGECRHYTHDHDRLFALKSSECTDFCQCEHASTKPDGSRTYKWAKHQCPARTLFDDGHKVCNYAYLVDCTESETTAKPTPKPIFTTEYETTAKPIPAPVFTTEYETTAKPTPAPIFTTEYETTAKPTPAPIFTTEYETTTKSTRKPISTTESTEMDSSSEESSNDEDSKEDSSSKESTTDEDSKETDSPSKDSKSSKEKSSSSKKSKNSKDSSSKKSKHSKENSSSSKDSKHSKETDSSSNKSKHSKEKNSSSKGSKHSKEDSSSKESKGSKEKSSSSKKSKHSKEKSKSSKKSKRNEESREIESLESTNDKEFECYKCYNENSNHACNHKTEVCNMQSCETIVEWRDDRYRVRKGCRSPTASGSTAKLGCTRTGSSKISCRFECRTNLCNEPLLPDF